MVFDRTHEVVKVCVDEPACDAVTFWGVTDALTWIDAVVGPNNYPLLFDKSYQRKPAYFGVRDAVLGK
jgi:endo-1,4-beta-xylanase